MPEPKLSKHLSPVRGEKPAMLLGDIALIHLALPFGADEGRIDQHETANGAPEPMTPRPPPSCPPIEWPISTGAESPSAAISPITSPAWSA